MQFAQPLEKTRIIKRYKRFLADVIHPEKGEITVHCPNTGSMKNCWQAGWSAWIADSQNPKRKYPYTWVLTETDDGQMIGINTHLANDIVYEAIENKQIEELTEYLSIKKEKKYGQENSRIDIWLEQSDGRETFIEIKSVTLKESQNLGFFPDAVTTRGQKHLRELMTCVEQGHRAVLFFLVQHSGIGEVSAASHIDADYAQLLKKAVNFGVEVLVYQCHLSPQSIEIGKKLPFKL
ncbi:DNA/RNA nuclease SfsA [Aliikangiella maris]|uniref:DNA/RNA nuclease SfsA n=2 Tax=Aliikangiella maris TaxID=3162458 RepID=A0ABV3MMC9_9GAMM